MRKCTKMRRNRPKIKLPRMKKSSTQSARDLPARPAQETRLTRQAANVEGEGDINNSDPPTPYIHPCSRVQAQTFHRLKRELLPRLFAHLVLGNSNTFRIDLDKYTQAES